MGTEHVARIGLQKITNLIIAVIDNIGRNSLSLAAKRGWATVTYDIYTEPLKLKSVGHSTGKVGITHNYR